MIRPQFVLDLNRELIVDNFAGGGGASTGIELALGRCVDHAINHDKYALGMHRINHPQTVHHCEDVFDVDPATVCEGRPVGLCHNSPDCKHFSKAKGGKPLDKRIRGLVLVMLKWAKYGARVMTMENVEEIVTWGPLKKMKKDGKWEWYADPKHKGRTWKAFLSILSVGIDPKHPDLPMILEVLTTTRCLMCETKMQGTHKICSHCGCMDTLQVNHYVTKEDCVRGFGYVYETQQRRACDLGTPTIRKRLYMVARRDGVPITWPEDTHAPKGSPRLRGRRCDRLKPYRTIAECLDWHLPCPSIFLDKAGAKRWRCKRPLAKATLRRIAKGVELYILKAIRPFIVNLTHQGGDRVESVDEPGRTVTGAHRGEKAVVAPVMTNTANSKTTGRGPNCWTVEEPVRTVTSAPGFAVTEATMAPFVTEHANASGQRNMPADEPGRTQCAQVKGGHFAVVAGTLVQTGYGEADGQGPRVIDPDAPGMTAVAGGAKQAAVAAVLVGAGGPVYSGKPKPVDAPMNTQTTENHAAVVSATLIGAGGRAAQSRPRGVDESLHTITAKGDTCLAAASMVKLRGNVETHSRPQDPEAPVDTISAGGTHHGVVAASIIRQFGNSIGQEADAPSPTVMAGGGGKTHLVAAHMTKFCTGSVGQDLRDPAPTVTAGSHSPETHGGAATPQGLVSAYLAQHNGGFNETPGHPATEPVSTIGATGSQQQLVAAHLQKYYGTDQDPRMEEPCHTVTTKDRFGLVESTGVMPMTEEQIAGARRVAKFLRDHGVVFEGEFATVQGYVIVDLGMRMLTPRELFRAQGFSDGYVIDRAWVIDPKTGNLEEIKLTKEQQIRMCGNSVCPPVMEWIIRCNVPELAVWYRGESRDRRKRIGGRSGSVSRPEKGGVVVS